MMLELIVQEGRNSQGLSLLALRGYILPTANKLTQLTSYDHIPEAHTSVFSLIQLHLVSHIFQLVLVSGVEQAQHGRLQSPAQEVDRVFGGL